MKRFTWVDISCVVVLSVGILYVFIFGIVNSNPPRKEYAFLKADVMYGNLPPNTARVSKCFERFVGYRANWNGKFYYITGTIGRNPFYPEHIYFSGNESVRIYGERFVPVFRSGMIEDKVEKGKNE